MITRTSRHVGRGGRESTDGVGQARLITSSSVVIGLVVRAARGRFGRLDLKAGVEARSREYVQFREPLRWRAGGSGSR